MKRVPAAEAAARVRAEPVSRLLGRTPALEATAWPELVGRLARLEQALPDVLSRALRKLLTDELALSPEHIRGVVRSVLERVDIARDPLRLRLHPGDVTLLDGLHLGSVQPVPDPTIEAGGCVLEGRDCTLDARLETRLTRVLDALRG